MRLTPLVDAGAFKYKYPSALQYTNYTLVAKGESPVEVRGIRAAKNFIKEKKEEDVEWIIADEASIIEPVEMLYRNLERAFKNICEVCNHTKPVVFIGSTGNFRYDIYPEYKHSRENVSPPHYKDQCEQWLRDNYNCVDVLGWEEDDALAMMQSESTCIVGEDKDLLQVAGYHYNPIKQVKTKISKRQGDFNLYRQIVAGDAGDDIPGIKGVGLKTADKLLAPAKSTKELYDISLKAYKNNKEEMHLTAQLVYLLRSETDSYLKRKEVTDHAA